MENETAKIRTTVGGRGIDSLLNSLFCQKISVREGKLNKKSCEKAENQESCLTRFGIYPIINISKGFNTFNINVYFYFVKYKIFKKYMLLFSVLKFLNAQKFRLMPLRASQLKFFAPQTYVCPKFRFCFGDAKKKKTEPKEEKTAPRYALTVNFCNILFKKETGCAFYGVRGRCAPPEPPSKATKSLRRRYAPQNSRVQFVAPQGLTPQGFAQC